MKKTVQAIVMQFTFAGIVFMLNAVVFFEYGPEIYYKVGLINAILLIANYFEFGFVANLRYHSAIDANDSLAIILSIFRRKIKEVVISMAILFIVYVAYANSNFPVSDIVLITAPVVIISPLVVLSSGIRAVYEGRGMVVKSVVIRGINGFIPSFSIFIILLITQKLDNVWVLISVVTLVYFSYNLASLLKIKSDKQNYLNVAPSRKIIYGDIGFVESVVTIFGAFFIYFDRFVIVSLGVDKSKAGMYIFITDIFLRYSLIYVPMVVSFYKRLVNVYNTKPKIGVKKVLKISNSIVNIMLGISVPFIVIFNVVFSYYSGDGYNYREVMMVSVILSVAMSYQAGNYLLQRFLGVLNISVINVIGRYSILAIIYTLTVVVLADVFSVVGIAIAFLLRVFFEKISCVNYLKKCTF